MPRSISARLRPWQFRRKPACLPPCCATSKGDAGAVSLPDGPAFPVAAPDVTTFCPADACPACGSGERSTRFCVGGDVQAPVLRSASARTSVSRRASGRGIARRGLLAAEDRRRSAAQEIEEPHAPPCREGLSLPYDCGSTVCRWPDLGSCVGNRSCHPHTTVGPRHVLPTHAQRPYRVRRALVTTPLVERLPTVRGEAVQRDTEVRKGKLQDRAESWRRDASPEMAGVAPMRRVSALLRETPGPAQPSLT